MAINTYTVYFTSGAIMEYTLPKLTSKQYREIMQELCFAADCHEYDRIEHARIYTRGYLVGDFDLFPWYDGTVCIFLNGQRVRQLFKEGKPAVCLF